MKYEAVYTGKVAHIENINVLMYDFKWSLLIKL